MRSRSGCLRWCRAFALVFMLAALATSIVAQASARPVVHPGVGGPHFVGYPTIRSAALPSFDFTQLDGIAAAEVRLIAAAAAGREALDQLEIVNQRVNRVPARADRDNYGIEDYWATPQEFFRRGGDCEDYAIAKYAILERLGWPSDRMWVVVLRETLISPPHAVLLVEKDGILWTLDNLGDRVFEHGRVDFYRPAYSVNRHGVWSHDETLVTGVHHRSSAHAPRPAM